MEHEVRILSIICFAIIGLSHVLQPSVWVSLFKFFISKHHVGAFLNGFMTLPMGVLIVSFHNVWNGIPLMLTVLGWCYIIKATICFCFPAANLNSLKRAEQPAILWQLKVAGGIYILIAGILSITLW